MKPIRGAKGRFAGSVGDGKTKIPTAAQSMMSTPGEVPGTNDVSVAQLHAHHIRQLAIQTDTEIEEVERCLFGDEQLRDIALDRLHYELGHRREYVRLGRRGFYAYTTPKDETLAEARRIIEDDSTQQHRRRGLETALAEYDQRSDAVAEEKARLAELNAIYLQHRWNRAFVVPGGHVHSSMECSTCNREGQRTKFARLSQYSGADENQIVEDAGERACTVCYPSAPVDVLSRPSRIFTEEEREEVARADERRAQREAARAARAAKAPTASGEPLVLTVGTREWRGSPQPVVEELKTERTAITYAVDIVAAQQTGQSYLAPYNVDSQRYEEVVDTIVRSLAEKRGVDVAVIREEIDKKAAAKVRKWRG